MPAGSGIAPGVSDGHDVMGLIRAELADVEEFMEQTMSSDIAMVSEVVRHILSSGGKRLRPALVMLSGRACGGTAAQLVPLAAALELVHTATLIHDDIVDESSTRRGVETVSQRWGPGVAVLTGDLMFAASFSILSGYGDPEILSLMSHVIGEMCTGEIEQYACRGDLDQTEGLYLKRIGRKTASLMSAATSLGATVGGGSQAERRALASYGYHLGMVFQIRDDILDLGGTSSQMGKNTAADLLNGVVTLPLIYALAHQAVGPELRRVLGPNHCCEAETASEVSRLVAAAGGLTQADVLARRYRELALEALEGLTSGAERSGLEQLVRFAVDRTS